MQPRILHIDFDENYAQRLYFNLLTIGLSCDHSSYVKDTLGFIFDRQYDILICEMDLQVVSGAEFIRAMKSLHPNLIVIVISNNGDIKDMEQAFVAGAQEYLVKGLTDDRITTYINGIMASGFRKQ